MDAVTRCECCGILGRFVTIDVFLGRFGEYSSRHGSDRGGRSESTTHLDGPVRNDACQYGLPCPGRSARGDSRNPHLSNQLALKKVTHTVTLLVTIFNRRFVINGCKILLFKKKYFVFIYDFTGLYQGLMVFIG